MDLRKLCFPPPKGAREARTCAEEDCERATEEGKPFCVEHLDQNPYAKVVLEKIAQRELDDQEAKERGHTVAKLSAITALEILCYLELRGERTFARICRDLNLEKKSAWAYVTKLHIHARITRTMERGVWRIRVRA